MTNITYKTITERCARAALDHLPAMPKSNFLDWWQAYESELEDFDAYDAAHEELDSWDWTIYTHYGVTILETLPSDIVNQAESEFFELWGSEPIDTLQSHYDMASRIAYCALKIVLCDEMENLRNQLNEVCQAQLENLYATESDA